MKVQASVLLTLLGATAAHAGGIERTSQSAMLLFAEGNRMELSYGAVSPSLTGRDYSGNDIGNVGNSYGLPSFGLKFDLSEKVAVALIYDTPFGADIEYDYGGANQRLDGTMAKADVTALTLLAKYQATDRVSVFGGIRRQTAEGQITLDGLAYGGAPPGGLTGYSVELNNGAGTGYVLGAAYEIPEIALRLALTYNSEISHDFDTVEYGLAPMGLAGTMSSKTPESLQLEFQTGIAADTLLMASIRHVKHSAFKIRPQFSDTDLVDLSDTTTYRLGVGRRFTPKLAGQVSVAYEAAGDPLVSPLAPSTGSTQLSLGLSYQVTEALEVSGGVSYVWLGDATPETGTPDTPHADFNDNSATALGLKIAYRF
ncbi:Long-chain fatty acid transport protein [Pseudooceanicola antarcticus]|uniref:Long-chain fatty acid transport protein n=1 Tax=Pseudooceanicola antarcticus TaxID=1247613 RepID=A0A285IW82_9RHOB|nr:outer membrane protein transport protein [Pseudooceanicola antarcticus]PJE25942.1 transporter [Pseudooceanicola antarcticus]SNY52299.1 Long-chain fatty acid transport protein [Pseudooceanicola antarcticus]